MPAGGVYYTHGEARDHSTRWPQGAYRQMRGGMMMALINTKED